jgi:hypothetical protein
MKKILWFAIFALCCSHGLRAQLNPVDTLIFEQGYSYGSYCPSYNCFNLYWTEPAAGNDTLVGYNIYRNSELFSFTNNTNIGCMESIPCDYMDFYNDIPFWITVKAVYNSDSLLSSVIDSVKVFDILINAGNVPTGSIRLQKNPVLQGEPIKISLPGMTATQCQTNIYLTDGKLISHQDLNINDGMIDISSTGLTTGMYVLQIFADGKEFTVKVIVE